MSHVRQQIRDAIKTACTGLTLTGSNVFVSRAWPVAEDKVPALTIRSSTEGSDQADDDGHKERIYTVEVVAHVRDPGDIDATIDDIIADVEAALGGSTLGGIVRDLQLVGIAVADDENGQPVGQAVMTWEAVYYTDQDDAETAR